MQEPNMFPTPLELQCFPQWLLRSTSTTNFRIPNDHLSLLPRSQKSNVEHKEKHTLNSSMASRALLLKQSILSVMHQVYNTNTSRSCCQLLTQSSLPWDPSKTTTFTFQLSPHLFQDSRRNQGGENAEPVRLVLFIGHERPKKDKWYCGSACQ